MIKRRAPSVAAFAIAIAVTTHSGTVDAQGGIDLGFDLAEPDVVERPRGGEDAARGDERADPSAPTAAIDVGPASGPSAEALVVRAIVDESGLLGVGRRIGLPAALARFAGARIAVTNLSTGARILVDAQIFTGPGPARLSRAAATDLGFDALRDVAVLIERAYSGLRDAPAAIEPLRDPPTGADAESLGDIDIGG